MTDLERELVEVCRMALRRFIYSRDADVTERLRAVIAKAESGVA